MFGRICRGTHCVRAEIYPNGKFGSIAVKVLITILRSSFFDDCYCIDFCHAGQQILLRPHDFGRICWFVCASGLMLGQTTVIVANNGGFEI